MATPGGIAVSLFFYYKPLGEEGWDLKPQLLASPCAPAVHVGLSIHLYLNNICFFASWNHKTIKEKNHPGDFQGLVPRKTPESLKT